ALPPGAVTPNTIIRWHQDDVTDDIYDHWGIDNVQITLNDPNFSITWLHDGYNYGLGAPGGNNPTPVCPPITTTYTAQISDGTTTCTESVTITVVDPVIVMTAGNDTTLCTGDCVTLDGDAYHLVSPASTPTFENEEFALVVSGNSDININVQGLNTTALTDGSITSICINGFSFSGSFICTDFAGCDCNGVPINFFDNCDLTSSGFTVTLTAPGGCDVVLVPSGVATGDYNNTCFVPVGGTPFGGTFPVGGTWDPQEPLSGLNGCDANGVWTLTFSAPGLGIGIGTLFGWNITFDDPQITAPVNFSWSPTTDMSGSNTLTPQVCPQATTEYTLTATDLAGCITVSEPVMITMQDCCALEIVSIATVDPACGANDGSIAVTGLLGEITGVTYALDLGAPQASATFTGLAPGQYTVTVNDDNGCPVQQVVDLVSAGGPSIDLIDLVQPNCGAADGSITITATGVGLQYSIDGGTTFQGSNSFQALDAGVYDIVVQDGTGCSADSTAALIAGGGPVITGVITIPPTCANSDGQIDITAPGATQFSIDNGAIFQGSGTFAGLPPGTYDIVVQDANGCGANTNAILPQPSVPQIIAIDLVEPTCGANDGSIAITADTTSIGFSIDGGATYQVLPDFIGLGGGNYNVVVVDAAGCIADSLVSLSTSGGPQFVDIVFVQPTCGNADGSISVVATPIGLQYSIDGGLTYQASPDFSGLAAGTYGIVIQDGAACTNSTLADLLAPPGPTIDFITEGNSDCGFSNGDISIIATGNGLQYSIDGGTTFQSSFDFNGIAPGTYDVVVMDAAGCTAQDVAVIMEVGGPVIIDVAQTPSACGSATGTISIDATGSNLTYSVDGGATFQGANSFTGLVSGSYTVVVENGCSATEDVVIAELPGPSISAIDPTEPLCTGDANGALLITAVGNAPLSYSIDGGASFQPSTSFAGLSAGNYTITVQDAGGCQATLDEMLGEPVAVTLVLDPQDPGCNQVCGGAASATAGGGVAGYTYTWSGGVAGNVADAIDLCPGTYTLTVSDANGCSISADFTITAPPVFAIDSVVVTNESCAGACDGTLTVFALNATSFQVDGGGAQMTGTFSGLCAGEHTVQAFADPDCATSSVATILPGSVVEAGFIPDPWVTNTLAPDFTFTNTSSGAITYEWNFGGFGTSAEQDAAYTFPEQAAAHEICLEAADSLGCTDTECINVVINPYAVIYTPNSFTPDGDEVNDIFLAIGDPALKDFELNVFNRWGELVFSATDILIGWDGTYGGTDCADGVYVWKIDVQDPTTADRQSYIGHVSLLR
ncbi:MAG: gliding motility-associated C-terminal domain-containing protein, partial [Flavobacteriales bacterium]|nr:gliding motility-associated C-terminal domain-containing protein [Flavobacteriales bacterium]